MKAFCQVRLQLPGGRTGAMGLEIAILPSGHSGRSLAGFLSGFTPGNGVLLEVLRGFEGRHGNLLQITVPSAIPVTKAWLTPHKRMRFLA
jgi:hypothetical protein